MEQVLDIDKLITLSTWDDPLNCKDPNDPFYGLPSGDSKVVYDLMFNARLITPIE